MVQPVVSISPLSERETRENNNLNFLRLLFAVMVIWAHSFAVLRAPEPGTGFLAVNGFFVLSGYLISGSWARKRSWREFLTARARRILPGWFAAIAVCTFVLAPLGSLDVAVTLREAVTVPQRLIPAFLLFQPTFPPTLQGVPVAGHLNASLWTLPYEFRLYLLVPLFGTAWLMGCHFRRRKIWWLPALLFALIYALYIAQTLRLWTPPALPSLGDSRVWSLLFLKPTEWPRFATYFAAGAILYVYRARLRPALVPTLVCLLFLLALALVWMRALFLVSPLVGSYAVMSVGLDARWRLPRIPANFDVSYGTYLYAWPIQQLLVHFLGAQVNVYLLFVLSSIGAMAAGTLSWIFVERPFLKNRRAIVN